MIDTSKASQGKETYNIVIRSGNGVPGTGSGINYNQDYNVDFDTLLRHHPEGQKFRLKWTLCTVNAAAHAGNHIGALYVNFNTRSQLYDTKYNNSHMMGFVIVGATGGGTYYLQHMYENTYNTISKPTGGRLNVQFRQVDDSGFFNMSNNTADALPAFILKIELQPIHDEIDE